MTDITVVWDPQTAGADWNILNGDIQVGSDLQTAVIISLFTDRRAPDSYAAINPDLRGWWGDTYSDTPWGSRLWTLSRASNSGAADPRLQARDYIKEALQWLIDDGVAASVNVAVIWLSGSALGFTITIVEPNKSTPTVFNFAWAWNS